MSADHDDHARRAAGASDAGGFVAGSRPAPPLGFRPVRARKPYEHAVDQIVEAIRTGALRRGDRLPSERILAEQMKISRPTLREAIRILTQSGVIGVRRGGAGGAIVMSDVIPASISPGAEPVAVSELADVLEARRMLEPRVAQLASVHGTNDDYEAMRQVLEDLERSGEDRERRLQLEARFDLALARATRNETVIELMRALLRRVQAVRGLVVEGEDDEPARTVQSHAAILRAIMAGDPVGIERVVGNELAVLERRWEAQTGRARLRRLPDFLLSSPERAPSR